MSPARVLFTIVCLVLMSAALAQQAMVSGSAPVSLGMSLQGSAFVLDAQVTEPSNVTVYCPVTPGLISFTGLTARVEASYDQTRRLLQLALPPGQYKITIRAF